MKRYFCLPSPKLLSHLLRAPSHLTVTEEYSEMLNKSDFKHSNSTWK